jgi:hypothetical protein
MLRLIHAQQGLGALYIDDIDDGLPNKQVKRLGSTGDPNAYKRDGYANAAKQACYIPRVNPADTTLPGYLDLEETERVTSSAFKGKIYGLKTAGLLTVVSLVASDLATPVIATARIALPAAGDLTITGTGFLSVSPEITTVSLWGTGVGGTALAPAITRTAAVILGTAPGAVSNTQIIIDNTLVALLAVGTSIRVRADARTSNTFIVTA